MNGCGTGKTADIQNPYSLTGDNSSVSSQFFARNLCVTDDINFGTDDDHYTTVYDMYLIFQEAIQTQDFIDIIHTKSYDAAYQNASGNTVTQTWESTNRYLNGQTTEPEDITVIGGKTGTTNAAGYCLVLYSKNKKGDDIVSIVYKGKTRSDMYTLMNQILSTFAN